MPDIDRSRTLPRIAAGVAATAVAGFALYYLRERTLESPDYTVIERDGAFSIRSYAPVLVAETRQIGERRQALEAGFRTLADYIFARPAGRAPGATPDDSLAMTTPVLLQQGRIGDEWLIRFALPKRWTAASAPEPASSLALTRLPPRTLAAWRFTGNAARDPQLVQAKLRALQAALARRGRTTTGEAELAMYNSPMIPAFLRRNEVWLELTD